MKRKKTTSRARRNRSAPRAGGVVIPRAKGGSVIVRTGGGPIVRPAGRRYTGAGWHPDIPDARDHYLDTPAFKRPLQDAKARLARAPAAKPPTQVDNREYCSPVEDQEYLGSCTAHAVVGMLEYMMRRGIQEHVDLSRLFLYKVTRRLLGWTGDTGAYIRTTIKAAAAFGAPPELHWPYDISRYDEEPQAFLYSYASNFQALRYARLDPYGASGKQTLDTVKYALAAGFVAAFGFPVYSSMTESPYVPYPEPQDALQGGHAVLAVGYDDNVVVEDEGGKKTKEGCLIFRNSWGQDWGESGYGYLPYRYVGDALAVDFWTVFRSEWLDEGRFS
jgi:C1A family cysteine protease